MYSELLAIHIEENMSGVDWRKEKAGAKYQIASGLVKRTDMAIAAIEDIRRVELGDVIEQ